MNRKHLPLVVSLLALLMVAAACPLLPAAAPTLQPTPVAQIAATATATAAVQQTNTPAAPPTETQVPATSTPASTNTPQPPTSTATQTGTPTEAPPLGPIADVCKFLDVKAATDLLGGPLGKATNNSVKGSWVACYTINGNATTGVTLALAQDKIAVDLHVNGYAMIDTVKGCAMPVSVSAAVVKTEHDAFDKLGLTGNALVREAYTRGYKLIQDKGCTDQYGVQVISGLGDAAFADHIWGYEELGTVYRNTVVYISAYKKGLPVAQIVDIEQKLLTPIMAQLASQ
jgi:hypothetical protein